jgi:large subunit ribosomal protein L10
MDRIEKQAEIELLSDYMKRSSISICADYRGLNVAEITDLRNQLRSVGSQGRVVKNTLARLSIQKAYGDGSGNEVQKFLDLFVGPSLLVYSFDDPVAPAKVLAKFVKDKKKLGIKGGFFEGRCVNEAGVAQLSTMPSREEVLGQLLRVIAAPATNVVRLLQAPAVQTVRVIEAQRKKIEEAS